jgi:hypothetical protein
MLFVGDDWAEAHHDVHLMDGTGRRLAGVRLGQGLEGIGRFHQLVAEHARDPSRVVVGIETDRGLWVTALVAAGYQVYAVNPLAVSRYRDRHHVSGAKSDPGDAKLLADLVRTDRHNHRLIAGDSPEVEEIKVLARAHQNLIWTRTSQTNTLRSALREYYPAALEAFGDLDHPDALAVLARASTPSQGAKLTVAQIRSALKAGGRQRNLDARAREIQLALRSEQMTAPQPLTSAFAAAVRATVGIIVEINHQISQIEPRLKDRFRQHPDTDIYLSMPGLGDVLGARALGEFGDDPDRYATTKSRRNYAGSSPITKTSGLKRVVTARHVRNRRLGDALDLWAFASLNASPGCRTYYDEHRAKGDTHHQALRALANRLVGILHGCLKTRTLYNEHTAWKHRQTQAA